MVAAVAATRFHFLRRCCLQGKDELSTWRVAAIVLIAVAAFVFLAQRFVVQFFDIVFEVCIFHIPAFTSAIIYLYIRRKQ